MSLSKYYQSSNSFQPEEIIKREGKNSPDWSALPQAKQLPFQTEPLPTATARKDNRPVDEHRQLDELPVPPPLPQDIDLSKYLAIAEADQKIAEAYQKGFETGVQTEKEKAEEDFSSTTRALLSICQQLDTVRETIIRNSSSELLEFSLTLAERIVRISVREQDSTIIATIEEALQRAIRSDEFTVYINPEDYEIVAEKSPEIIAGLTGLHNIILKKDLSLERGGAKIESDNCTIDATIGSQFDVIREEIKKNL